jgi:hypothetical protein
MLVPEEICMPAPDDRRNQMLDLARRWRDSGARARAFAQEHGVTPWVLYYWGQRLAREERPTRRRKPLRRVKLASVHVVASAARDGGGELEIVLASGDRVRVAETISPEALCRVVQVLRASC